MFALVVEGKGAMIWSPLVERKGSACMYCSFFFLLLGFSLSYLGIVKGKREIPPTRAHTHIHANVNQTKKESYYYHSVQKLTLICWLVVCPVYRSLGFLDRSLHEQLLLHLLHPGPHLPIDPIAPLVPRG